MLPLVDRLLRGEGRHAPGRGGVPWREIAAVIAAGGFVQGAVMGFHGGRALQALYSGIKVPLLLGVSTLLCLPSFYVLNALLGLRADFAAACRGVLSAQAALAACLAALSPLTALVYLSSDEYLLAIVFNGAVFAAATAGGQVMLARHYGPLVAANRRHRFGKLAWVSLYVFVAIQMAWVLRPFVGLPGFDTRFFRDDAWSNAYVRVLRIVWRWLGGW